MRHSRSQESIYGATFFMATGFHGFHVIIGTIFLAVCLLRPSSANSRPTSTSASNSRPGTGISSTWCGCSCSPASMSGEPGPPPSSIEDAAIIHDQGGSGRPFFTRFQAEPRIGAQRGELFALQLLRISPRATVGTKKPGGWLRPRATDAIQEFDDDGIARTQNSARALQTSLLSLQPEPRHLVVQSRARDPELTRQFRDVPGRLYKRRTDRVSLPIGERLAFRLSWRATAAPIHRISRLAGSSPSRG